MFYFNLGRKQKIIISLLFTLLLLSIYMIMSTHVYAAAADDKISGLTDKTKGWFNTALTILQYLAYTAGVFFIFAALFKFDQHKKNPTQIPMSQPLTLFVIGAALLVLPTIVQYAGGDKDKDNKISLGGG